jgi:hypothetical protein
MAFGLRLFRHGLSHQPLSQQLDELMPGGGA